MGSPRVCGRCGLTVSQPYAHWGDDGRMCVEPPKPSSPTYAGVPKPSTLPVCPSCGLRMAHDGSHVCRHEACPACGAQVTSEAAANARWWMDHAEGDARFTETRAGAVFCVCGRILAPFIAPDGEAPAEPTLTALEAAATAKE